MSKAYDLTRGKTLPDTSQKADFHDLLDDSSVTVSDLRQDEIIAGSGLVVRSTGAPSDTDALHVDTDDGYRLKVYNGSAWLEVPTIATPAQGNINYHNGTNWVALAPGTSGQFLKTLGAASNPLWADNPAAVASKAEMEAASSLTVFSTPGREQYHPGVAKAWLHMTTSGGTVTLQDSYNVSSITDRGVGLYTAVWTTGFASANYAWSGSLRHSGSTTAGGPTSTSAESDQVVGSLQFTSQLWTGGTIVDPARLSLIAWGDQ